MSAVAPPRSEPASAVSPPQLLVTRAEFEAAAEDPGARVEWPGVTDETRDGEPQGLAWAVTRESDLSAAVTLNDPAITLPLAEIDRPIFPK